MDLTYATIVVLASMIFVLSAMIGYLYWQQTRLQQNMQSLGLVVSALVNPPMHMHEEVEPEAEQETVQENVRQQVIEIPTVAKVDEDDRVSVEHVTRTPTPSKEVDLDDLDSKTKQELHAILQEKGIPYTKSDKKSTLIEILKATS